MTAASPGSGGRRVLRIGKYEVKSYIATGGMGAVYRAVDVDLGRTVALKILQPDLARKPKVVERFRREARSAARLNHENIVTVYEFAEIDGTYLLALEFVEGKDLHEYVATQGRRPPEEACFIVTQAARALAHAHGQGIIHRDIKPSNFLLTRKDERQHLKLTDFGLARAVGEDEPALVPGRAQGGPPDYVARLTTLGSTVGTVDYMSPEQARDSGSADCRSDIYSLGCTLYFMLAGDCPFPGGTPAERLLKHVELPPPDVRVVNPAVPDGLAAVLERMLAKNPADRYQTPQELLHDLENMEHLNDLPAARHVPIPFAEAPVPAPPPTAFAERTPPTGEIVPPRKLRPAGLPSAREDEKRRKNPARRKRKPGSGVRWLWATAALGGLALTAGVAVLLAQMQSAPDDDADMQVLVQPPQPKPKPGRATSAEGAPNLFPVPSTLPRLYTPAAPLRLPALQEEYEGPLAGLVTPVVGNVVYRVSRTPLGEPNTFRSLEEAVARAPAEQQIIIEIHDNGPVFVPSLPTLVNRNLVLRAGQGFRPLLAWDAAADSGTGADPKRSSRLVALERGSLALEDLEVVFKTESGTTAEPPVLFHVNGGTLTAWKCSFSTAGNDPRGVVLARLVTSGAASNCRLRRCYARGARLTVLKVEGSGAEGAEVLLENCLLVGNEQPLLHITAQDEAWTTLRVVRSTLIAGQALLRIDAAGPGESYPHLHWRGWDSVLARGSLQTAGDLVALGAGVRTDKMSWRVVNCLYAGWRNLLSRPGGNLDGSALEEWHRQWIYSGGDKSLSHPWPIIAPASLAQILPITYQTAGTAASWAATSHGGPLGCDVALVAPGQPSWLKRTYEPSDVAPLAVAGQTPAKAPAASGLYKGEKLDLGKVDVGKHLQTKLAGQKPAPRVVLELYGKAVRSSSPIRVRGFDLVLTFPRASSRAEPSTLAVKPMEDPPGAAFIDVEDGSLEIMDGRISMAGLKPAALPDHLIRVRGGDLRLADCRLFGPLAHEIGNFKTLIDFHGAGDDANDEPRDCAIADCLLQASKTILRIEGSAARARLRNNVLITGEDALRFDFGSVATPRLNVQCALEHNTMAVRGSVLVLPDTPGVPYVTLPVVIRADANVFLDPFAEMPRHANVLRFHGKPIPRGVLLWQGKGNAYDPRLLAFAVRADGLEEVQTLKDWTNLWGTPGERQPYLLAWPAGAKNTFSLEIPRTERLALPPEASTHFGAVLPGADLVGLGLAKK